MDRPEAPTAMLIDTDKAKQRLRQGGVAEEQAGAIIDLWRMSEEHVATKQDIALLRRDMEAFEERLTQRIYRAALTVVGINLAALSIAVAILLASL